MPDRTPKSVLIAILLWVVILGGMAAAVRYLILPGARTKRRQGLAAQTGSGGKYKHHVQLAADGFSGYCLLRSPELAERLSREGIKFTVVDDGADYMQRLRDLRDGIVDMAVFPVNSFIQCGVRMDEFPASIVYVIDETRGADAIVAHGDSVSAISDLNSPSARIMVTPDSPSEFLARVMIASFSLPDLHPTKWMTKAKGSADAFKAFRGQSRIKPIAYAMWEPDVSRALQEKDAHILLDSSKLKGFIVDVLVVRREFLIENYDTARKVVENYARTAFVNQAKMVQLVTADAREIGETLSRTDAEQIVKGIEWKNTLENYAHFDLQSAGHSLENIEDIILKITDVLVKTGALDSDPLVDGANSLYFNKLVRELQAANFHPGRDIDILGTVDPGGPGVEVRETRALQKLSTAQWASLLTVGELRVKPITFGRGTARVSVQSRHELAALATTLNSWPQYYLTVTGRVRPGGDEAAALQLARDRADAAVQELTRHGVALERIRAISEMGRSDTASAQSVSFVVGELPY